MKEFNNVIYVLVEWPEVQELMTLNWFKKEAKLSDNSSYFIPIKRYKELNKN
jgi:hypothetical protein